MHRDLDLLALTLVLLIVASTATIYVKRKPRTAACSFEHGAEIMFSSTPSESAVLAFRPAWWAFWSWGWWFIAVCVLRRKHGVITFGDGSSTRYLGR